MNKKATLIILSIIFLTTVNVYANNEKVQDNYFKIERNSNEIISKESINVFDSNNNKIGGKSWSSAVILSNGNLLVGQYKSNKTYDYYEINKQGKQNFIINTSYYIKDINNETGNFITVNNENGNYYMGVLDKEFNLIFNTIFSYKENAFVDYIDILKVKDKGYGVFDVEGNQIISPIFDSIKKIDNNSFQCVYKDTVYTLKNVNGVYINQTAINSVDSWAKDSVEKATNLGFISQDLQLKLNNYITREEFCEIIVKLYEEKTKFEIPNNINNPFIDTNNEYIIKAYGLGIVSGKSSNRFEPNSFITREESAVILSNLLKKMEYATTEIYFQYDDEKLISNWAKDSVQKVSNAGIMIGSKNNFNPKNNYKVVEAISTIMRIYNLK